MNCKKEVLEQNRRINIRRKTAAHEGINRKILRMNLEADNLLIEHNTIVGINT